MAWYSCSSTCIETTTIVQYYTIDYVCSPVTSGGGLPYNPCGFVTDISIDIYSNFRNFTTPYVDLQFTSPIFGPWPGPRPPPVTALIHATKCFLPHVKIFIRSKVMPTFANTCQAPIIEIVV